MLQVKSAVYTAYLRSLGGWTSLCAVVAFILYQVRAIADFIFAQLFNVFPFQFKGSSMYSNIWLSDWSNANATNPSDRDLYLGVYGALGVGQCKYSFAFVPQFLQLQLSNFSRVCIGRYRGDGTGYSAILQSSSRRNAQTRFPMSNVVLRYHATRSHR